MKRLQQKKSMPKIVGIAVIVLIVVLLGGAIIYTLANKDKAGENGAVGQLASEQTSGLPKLDEQKQDDAPKRDPSKEYAKIDELNVQYQATPETKSLLYAHMASTNDEVATVSFSTKKMSSAKDERGKKPCSSKKAPSGMISRYKNGATKIEFTDQTIADVGKKVGDFYYVYSEPRFTCIANDITAQDIKNSAAAVRHVYDTLLVLVD